MDDFFTKKICDRCGGDLTTRIMSKFNTDVICHTCHKKEMEHPLYKKACDAVREEELNGNNNFEGIGKPADL